MKNKQNKNAESLKRVLFIVWTVISIILFLVILVPLLFDRQLVLQISPACQSAKYGVECALCGMTRAFVEISEGHFSEAISLNKGSIWVFGSILLNTLLYVVYLTILKKTFFQLYNTKKT